MLSVGTILCLASSAAGKGQHVEVADAFLDLSLQHGDVSSDTLAKIERLMVVMYSRMCSASGVNEARK